ncbi:MAG TPA: helix-turn-helix domain-containing protein [Kofleriaceae bacterium]|nr:helix-turn-helix domain-containing protein [Kofleriaceae bacterium]
MSAAAGGPVVVAVASGKGGTGKSLLAANLSLLLASFGKRVVAVDAALGDLGLYGMLGVGETRLTLRDALKPGGPPLGDLVMVTAVAGLGLIASEAGAAPAELDQAAAAQLAPQLGRLDADYVVVDLPSGCSRYVVELLVTADLRILVLLPEPPAVELAARLLRASFGRSLERAGMSALVADGRLPIPLDMVERAPQVREHMLGLRAAVVLNAVRSRADVDLGAGIATAMRRRLGLPVRYSGHVEYDDAVWVSQRRRRALLIEHPESRAAKGVEKVMRRLLARDAEAARAGAGAPGESENHYQLLEVAPTASDEEIRRAHRRVRQMYGRDSVAVSGLYTRDGLDALQLRFDEAYATLMDGQRRKAYDQRLFPDGVPSAGQVGRAGNRRRATSPDPARGPAPSIPPDADWSGRLLREVREALGIELREISERTKVGIGYLSAIEEEVFEKLPAPVYVRGFLVEYVKMLGVDLPRVLETYFQRFLASRAPEPPA